MAQQAPIQAPVQHKGRQGFLPFPTNTFDRCFISVVIFRRHQPALDALSRTARRAALDLHRSSCMCAGSVDRAQGIESRPCIRIDFGDDL